MLSRMNGRNRVPCASTYTVCVHVFGVRVAIVSSKKLEKLFVCTSTYWPTPQVMAELEHVPNLSDESCPAACGSCLVSEDLETLAVVHSADIQSAAICQAPTDGIIRFAGS